MRHFIRALYWSPPILKPLHPKVSFKSTPFGRAVETKEMSYSSKMATFTRGD